MRRAYSFEDSNKPSHVHRALQDQPGQQELENVVREWHEVWHTSRPVLRVYDDGRRLQIFDTRPCARQSDWTAGELEAEIYRLCDSAQTPAALLKQLSGRRARALSMQDIEPAIETLCDAKVLLSMNGRLLSVGVDANRPV